MTSLVKEDVGDRIQRENIFLARCLILDKTYNVIVDGDNCVNIASTTLAEKLRLLILKHPRPYSLQWLNNSNEIKVIRQVLISPYRKEEVLYDVVPIHARHLLHNRPWQFDKKTFHDGYRSSYTLEKDGQKFTHAPLSP